MMFNFVINTPSCIYLMLKRRSDQQFNITQEKILEQIFKIDTNPDYETRKIISELFNRTEKSILIWFFIKRKNIKWDTFNFLNFLK
jgi:hypothetical protein